MSQQHNIESLPYENRMALAVQAMEQDAKLSDRRAAATYNVKRRTLRDRRAGKPSRRDVQPNSSNLKKTEEEAMVQYIRKLDAQGFAPTLNHVGDMANQLLAARGGGQVGENWVTNFVRRKPELKSQLN